ncbi:xanthine dehydrogenase family protein molybdopterin-binding subunit [Stygiolobus azoricus]|uniref:Molybdopterin-dependent oxidoreductase n=1 Tax=Stygiolobus azoricus TaxID=41675 RepID=A0A650CP18_9CREN|nr:xanthine dehydrogenase family protein [Stygiolobus azoricus]QGR19580.1 molybdopterin-dependent oxidoreductase [Stygiolobus azoricus]
MRWNLTYVDDIAGSYQYVNFVRSTYEHAKFDISGRAFTYEDIKEFKIPYLYDRSLLKLPTNLSLLPRFKAVYKFQPLAVVIGEDPYKAEDLAENVTVDYTPVSGPLYEEIPDNIIYREEVKGEVEGKNVITLTLDFDRNSQYSLEGRVLGIRFTGDDMIIHISTQIPTVVRMLVSEMLEIPQHRIIIDTPRVGGGFGAKQDVIFEELTVIALAYKLGKNLKWVEKRIENVMTSQARGQRHEVNVGFNDNGKIESIYDKITYDVGAYLLPWTGISPLFVTLATMKAVYDYELYYNAIALLTNKPPQGAYRGFGRPEAVFVIERIIDEVARYLKKDPLEVREVNLKEPSGDVGDVKTVLAKLRHKYYALKEKYGKGVGVSFYIQYAAPNSEIMIKHEKSLVPGYECARAILDTDGWIEVEITATDQGQMMDRAIRNLIVKELGYDKVRVKLAVTNVKGSGVWASRTMLTMGNAALLAIRELKNIAKKIDPELNWEKLAIKMRNEPWLVKDISSVACYEPPQFVGTVSGQISVITVDEFSRIKPIYHYIIADVGVVGDKDNVIGQLIGGALQGISGSLYESVKDEYSYLIAKANESPFFEVELLHTPSSTPTGVRGVGENGPTGAYAAVINAVNDYGIRCNKVPLDLRECE